MAAPVGAKKVQAFKPPVWMLNKARRNVELAKVYPEAVAKKLQETRDQAAANSEEHQAKMRVLGAQMEELRAKHDLNPFKNVEQAEQAETAPVITPKVITPSPVSKRKAQVQKTDERRAKKQKVRAEQTKVQEPKGKLTMPSKAKKPSGLKDQAPKPALAESSTAGTTREAAAAAANNPEHMDIDVEPSNRLFVRENETNSTPQYTALPLPSWHRAITINNVGYKALEKRRPQALNSLETLKECIRQCYANIQPPTALGKLQNTLRDHVHKAEFLPDVTIFVVRKANILHPANGLPRIFTDSASFPSDLKADAYQLYTRWYRQDFENNIMRGIRTVTKDRNADRIDETYKKQFPGDAKYYGAGDLVLGQWWPTQLCTVRDGAHGAAQGGIFGEKEKGTYSIVMSGGGGYHDDDHGDTITYSGTDGRDFTPTENTLRLVESSKLGNPVRVIRSAQLNKSNKYRPEMGLRYDGLYTVKGYTITDLQKQIHRFVLVREEGQEQIRCEGRAKRPTGEEKREFERLRAKWV
jgi:hypothetical protein